jgi:hypothetical protein
MPSFSVLFIQSHSYYFVIMLSSRSSPLFASAKAESKTEKKAIKANKKDDKKKVSKKDDKKNYKKKDDKKKDDKKVEIEGKKAAEDAPPVNIGWDSHKAVVSPIS